jgi:ribbon-helix-helix CopG family protein
VSPKRYYTLMMEQELIDALKEAKEQTGLSEGALIRQALRAFLAKEGVPLKRRVKRKGAKARES